MTTCKETIVVCHCRRHNCCSVYFKVSPQNTWVVISFQRSFFLGGIENAKRNCPKWSGVSRLMKAIFFFFKALWVICEVFPFLRKTCQWNLAVRSFFSNKVIVLSFNSTPNFAPRLLTCDTLSDIHRFAKNDCVKIAIASGGSRACKVVLQLQVEKMKAPWSRLFGFFFYNLIFPVACGVSYQQTKAVNGEWSLI